MQWNRRLALGLLGAVALGGCATMEEPKMMKEKSLYDRLGGKAMITAVVDDFVARVAVDRRINRFFLDTDIPPFKAKLVDQICEASGGPCKYIGKDTKTTHQMIMTSPEVDALVEDFRTTLHKLKIVMPSESNSEKSPFTTISSVASGKPTVGVTVNLSQLSLEKDNSEKYNNELFDALVFILKDIVTRQSCWPCS